MDNKCCPGTRAEADGERKKGGMGDWQDNSGDYIGGSLWGNLVSRSGQERDSHSGPNRGRMNGK